MHFRAKSKKKNRLPEGIEPLAVRCINRSESRRLSPFHLSKLTPSLLKSGVSPGGGLALPSKNRYPSPVDALVIDG